MEILKNLKVAIIGLGKVGTTLALDFTRKKIKIVALVDRDLKSASSLARKIKTRISSNKISDIPIETNLFVITVQDRFISEIDQILSKTFSNFRNKYVFHTSGALTSEELKFLKRKGCNVFSLHPNFSFVWNNASMHKLIDLNGCMFTIESKSKKAILFAEKFCKKLGYEFIKINTEQKTLYHILSVMISNYTVTNFYQVEKYFGKNAIKSYLYLLKSTIRNIEEFGVKNSLTGPIVRGDLITIQKHSEMLSKIDRNLKDIYLKSGKLTLEMIYQDLDKKSVSKLKKFFL